MRVYQIEISRIQDEARFELVGIEYLVKIEA
jgi:hypothetical protein